uniref:ATP synthase complex subunit 8 n=1 Tax=Eutropis multifasciata TaxID=217868 RepID=A0A8F4WFD6_EUTMU|nr:ATP synthase F0 subunit 8 [Eutropis multifasciata]QXG82715.1 ATP synthase F0 subunit 8 [Eutropis multifasciata]UPO66919.1 ATP synthase F0 subunit 8 [Eutropis multifasciata]UZC57559.1 ATP synthase F0 subunit 8 [Eutropis multifasciata]UZC57572.1 ATP synthase F0 subunit 8 [Eutropis multifasciata]
MPQLNPSPWFLILLLSWMTLLMMFKTKALSIAQENTPVPPTTTKQQTTSWTWPWT